MIIILLGYMASGKSTIGKDLAGKINYKFIDLDKYIEDQEKQSISDLFETKGEIYFRKRETIILNEIINTNEKLVLSLGGGTPCYSDNMSKITNVGGVISIYLKTAIPTLAKRLEDETNKRPLIAHLEDKEALIEFIGKHLFERVQYYNLSDLIVNTDHKTTTDIVSDILLELF